MSTATSIPKQQQRRRYQQQQQRISNYQNSSSSSRQSRNSNAYFDQQDYHRNYWNQDYYSSSSRYFYPLSNARTRKDRFSSNYEHLPPRHRPQSNREKRETTKISSSSNETKSSPTVTHQTTKLSQSPSSTSTHSDPTTNHRKDLPMKHSTAAVPGRQPNPSTQSLMNSFIQQPNVQFQTQLTNALLATMIQQRLKEVTLQAQAALPTILAAQALAYQHQLAMNQSNNLSPILSPNIAHPGTKFNNGPLVKFPVVRSSLAIHPSRHRLNPQTIPTTTYQQVQEIERGISLDEAIHLKNAIDVADQSNGNSINSL